MHRMPDDKRGTLRAISSPQSLQRLRELLDGLEIITHAASTNQHPLVPLCHVPHGLVLPLSQLGRVVREVPGGVLEHLADELPVRDHAGLGRGELVETALDEQPEAPARDGRPLGEPGLPGRVRVGTRHEHGLDQLRPAPHELQGDEAAEGHTDEVGLTGFGVAGDEGGELFDGEGEGEGVDVGGLRVFRESWDEEVVVGEMGNDVVEFAVVAEEDVEEDDGGGLIFVVGGEEELLVRAG